MEDKVKSEDQAADQSADKAPQVEKKDEIGNIIAIFFDKSVYNRKKFVKNWMEENGFLD